MREEFSALVFGPGLPPGGAQGVVTITAAGIEVSAQERFQSARFSELSLREVGFVAAGVELAWNEGGEIWAAHVLDSTAARRLLARPAFASAQLRALQNKQRRGKVARTLGWSLITAFVLLPILLLTLLVLNSNRLAEWAVNQIPLEQEVAMGRQAFANMRGTLQLRDSGPAYDAVQAIVTRLTSGSHYHYEVHVTKDASLNAFAIPGGIIVVHTGLIAATTTPEELAGVLAHEVQHVEQRHSIRGMVKDLGLRGLWAAVTGDVGATLAGQAALEMTRLKFSRDDESEADTKGFNALVDANINPAGMAAFFKIMSKQAADAPAAFLSTHPLSVDREKTLKLREAQLPQREFAKLNSGPWPPQAP